ncbi:MAG: hypothetical protein ACAH95_01145 [Fimbriimonas sp.]
MKSSNASFLPIGLALVVTMVIGWVSKKNPTPAIPDPTPPAITVQQRAAGSGNVPEALVGTMDWTVPVEAAAWVSFDSYLDGKKRPPEKGVFQMKFVARDEEGREWPMWFDHSTTTTYAMIPKGVPALPKRLMIECSAGGIPLGVWKVPPLAKPVRRLTAANIGPSPERDYPGWSITPQIYFTSGGANANIGVEVKALEAKDGESVYAVILGHSYGRHNPGKGAGAFIRVPSFFLPYLDLVDLEVVRSRNLDYRVNVPIRGGRVETLGLARAAVLDAPSSVPLDATHRLVFQSAREGLRVSVDGLDDRMYSIGSARADGQRVRVQKRDGRGSARIIVNAPATGDDIAPFTLSIECRIYRMEPPRRYVMKLDRSKAVEVRG